MSRPFWFELIKQWREKGMGRYGVLFPFLVGAVAKQNGKCISKEFIEDIFLELINNPVNNYYCEVRWCGNIDEPVASIESSGTIKRKSIQAYFKDENDEISLAFTSDLMSMFTLKLQN